MSGGSSNSGAGIGTAVVISFTVVAIVTGVDDCGKYLFEFTHGGYAGPASGSWGSMYINMSWGVSWGIVALGLFIWSAFERDASISAPPASYSHNHVSYSRFSTTKSQASHGIITKGNIQIAGLAAAILAVVFGVFVSTHFAHKVGVSSPWWGTANVTVSKNHQSTNASASNGLHAGRWPSRTAIPPTQAHLVCDIGQSAEYVKDGNDCTMHHMYTGDSIVLEISGFTPTIVKHLCRRKYHDEWSTSSDRYGDTWLASGMCPVPIDGFGSDNELMASFQDPGKLGRDVVTWRLISPSGRTVLTARYKFRVLETDTQPLATPPS
jgi:hypothetical protein